MSNNISARWGSTFPAKSLLTGYRRLKASGLVLCLGACLNVTMLHAQNLPEMPPVPVEVENVQQKVINHGIVATGELKANRSVVLRAEIAGKVASLHLPEGKSVETGTVLVALEDDIAKASLKQAKAKQENSLANYKRLQTLMKKGSGSVSQKDEAYANLRSDEANVELAKAMLARTKIKAPFSGIVGLKQISVGDYVDIGKALINLEDIHSLLIDFKVPEKYLLELKEGQTVEVTSEAVPGKVFGGKIYAISPQIDNVTRSIQARALILNEQKLLRPGLFAKVKIVFSSNQQALVVPEHAVFMQQNKNYVYRILDNKAVMTEIKVGAREHGYVEVLKGLSLNDKIAKSGRMRLFDGATVSEIMG